MVGQRMRHVMFFWRMHLMLSNHHSQTGYDSPREVASLYLFSELGWQCRWTDHESAPTEQVEAARVKCLRRQVLDLAKLLVESPSREMLTVDNVGRRSKDCV